MERVRPRLYLSGPISSGGSLPLWEQKEHVRFATELAFSFIRKGYSVLCPHWSLIAEEIAHDRLPHSLWIDNDLRWVEISDAIYRIPGDSKGADLEVAHAKLKNIPVFSDFQMMDSVFRAKGMLP